MVKQMNRHGKSGWQRSRTSKPRFSWKMAM